MYRVQSLFEMLGHFCTMFNSMVKSQKKFQKYPDQLANYLPLKQDRKL